MYKQHLIIKIDIKVLPTYIYDNVSQEALSDHMKSIKKKTEGRR